MINLAKIQRPSRYIDSELNAIHKPVAEVKLALAFPDVYDVGMSHLGLKVLYNIANALPYAAAERAFHPWTDMETALRASGDPLRSLESNTPLAEFDLLGVSLQYELSYPTVLNMLDLAQIPMRAEARTDAHPIVIAGGPCTTNPMPMARFMDAFFIGDAEDAIIDILDTVRRVKREGDGKRATMLAELAKIEGMYVPSIHGTGQGAHRVRMRTIASLEDAPYPTKPIVPYNQIVHDRIAIEVSRGCPMGCRFCQAGMLYRPVRERTPAKIIQIAEQCLANTGYEEVSFTSLSAGDYSSLHELMHRFNEKFSSRKIAVSLPSLRVAAVNREILKEIRSVRKTGFTIAPEAATERLRAVINKDFKAEDFERAAEILFSEGWLNLKLYYMIGLPTETDADIEAIPEMVMQAREMSRRHSPRPANITVSVSPFVPKAHTPFQWFGFRGTEYVRERIGYLKKKVRKATLKYHDERTSLLEAVIARGGADLADLLESAHAHGCRLDAWSECFDMSKWMSAFGAVGIDPEAYAGRQFELDDPLPWDMIDIGVTSGFMKQEYARAMEAAFSPACTTKCLDCGLKCGPSMKELRPKAFTPPAPLQHRVAAVPRRPIRLRVRFSKSGPVRYTSHRELMTLVARALNRAGIALEYSQGFHPTPKLAFGPPLSVGVASTTEYLDMELMPMIPLGEMKQRLNDTLPPGVELHEMKPIDLREPSLQAFIETYIYEVAGPALDMKRAREFMAAASWPVQREKGAVDIRPMALGMEELGPTAVRMVMSDLKEKKLRLDEMCEALFNAPVAELDIIRTGLYGRKGGKLATPMGAEGPRTG